MEVCEVIIYTNCYFIFVLVQKPVTEQYSDVQLVTYFIQTCNIIDDIFASDFISLFIHLIDENFLFSADLDASDDIKPDGTIRRKGSGTLPSELVFYIYSNISRCTIQIT